MSEKPKPAPTAHNMMKPYRYKALTQTGRMTSGLLTAKNEAHLDNILQKSGLELIRCKEEQTETFSTWIADRFGKIQVRDLTGLFVQLLQLNKAGVPLLESLEYASEFTVNPKLRNAIFEIRQKVFAGLSLSEAMKYHTKIFDKFHVSFIGFGEKSGNLNLSYEYLIDYCKWVDENQRRAKKATRYPILVLTVASIAIFILMGVVVPQITSFFTNISQGKELPIVTVALINTSEFCQNYWLVLILSIIGLVITFKTLRKLSHEFTRITDKLLLNAPLFGTLIRKIELTRYLISMNALYDAGIPLIEALKTSSETMKNTILREAAEEARESVQVGKSLSEAMEMTDEFPKLLTYMLKSAEETGKISEVFRQVVEFYSKDVDEEIQKMIAMIEPGLTLIMGILVLWISVGTFGPIYSLFEEIEM